MLHWRELPDGIQRQPLDDRQGGHLVQPLLPRAGILQGGDPPARDRVRGDVWATKPGRKGGGRAGRRPLQPPAAPPLERGLPSRRGCAATHSRAHACDDAQRGQGRDRGDGEVPAGRRDAKHAARGAWAGRRRGGLGDRRRQLWEQEGAQEGRHCDPGGRAAARPGGAQGRLRPVADQDAQRPLPPPHAAQECLQSLACLREGLAGVLLPEGVSVQRALARGVDTEARGSGGSRGRVHDGVKLI
mmetsp:Transcript_15374/g.39133  ORF Transcript_15374/g.39133 Transcript_15374/m.39133 type:complete len:244 (-) Transcript_15374:29-760(-)